MSRDGAVTVYAGGARAGGASAPADGIFGDATRPRRFAADQGGGQRLSGAVDRTAAEAATWQPSEPPSLQVVHVI
jgi:alpha-L-fucosidase 2